MKFWEKRELWRALDILGSYYFLLNIHSSVRVCCAYLFCHCVFSPAFLITLQIHWVINITFLSQKEKKGRWDTNIYFCNYEDSIKKITIKVPRCSRGPKHVNFFLFFLFRLPFFFCCQYSKWLGEMVLYTHTHPHSPTPTLLLNMFNSDSKIQSGSVHCSCRYQRPLSQLPW